MSLTVLTSLTHARAVRDKAAERCREALIASGCSTERADFETEHVCRAGMNWRALIADWNALFLRKVRGRWIGFTRLPDTAPLVEAVRYIRDAESAAITFQTKEDR